MKILLLLLIFVLPNFLYGQEANSWDFPIRPGSAEWKKYKEESHRIEAMQIPEEIINKMDAKEFAHTIVNFPLFGYYSAFNTPQEGFNIMFSRFNIFKKLCERNNIDKHFI